jgi:hypothetical protein
MSPDSAFARLFPAPIRRIYEHAIVRRLFWFAVGGALSVGCNYALFRLFGVQFGLNPQVAYALSLAVMTGFTFAWSYFVNFRTDNAWHLCVGKYVATLGVCYVINFMLTQIGFSLFSVHNAIVIGIVQVFGACGITTPGQDVRDAFVIGAVQVFVAFVKFGIFHYWVFPARAAAETRLHP